MLWAARDYARAGEYRREALDRRARASATTSLVARSLNRVGNWHVNLDEPQAGLPHHEEALAIFERLGDSAASAETVDLIAMAHHIGGDQRAAATYFERSVAAVHARWTTGAASPTRSALLALCGPSYHVVRDDAVHERRGARTSSAYRGRCASRARSAGAPASRSCASLIGDVSCGGASTTARSRWRARRSISAEADRASPVDRARRGDCSARSRSTCWRRTLAREQLEAAHEIAQRLGSRVWIRWTAAPLAVARARTLEPAGAIGVLDRAAARGWRRREAAERRPARGRRRSPSASVSSGSRAPSSR